MSWARNEGWRASAPFEIRGFLRVYFERSIDTMLLLWL
jgi:hypothetical protein